MVEGECRAQARKDSAFWRMHYRNVLQEEGRSETTSQQVQQEARPCPGESSVKAGRKNDFYVVLSCITDQIFLFFPNA